jgi:Protein kinase domain
MAEDARLGTEVAGYRIVGVAGRGGMGVVYVAEDARLGRRVALKLLPPDLAEDDRFRDRFVRESRLAASIEHPHIVPIYAAGDAEDTLFIAMRLIPGTDLRTLLAEHGTLDPHRATTLITQIAGALDAAHDHGLVHRDVKPANILVETRAGADHAYLSDFGLTKQASSVTGLTGTGQLVGTIDYLAPEQIDGKPADGRTDQYALACVLYQCLTGTPPYSRDTEAATLWAHMQEPPPTLTDHRPDLPPAINPVLRRALAKPPDNRYPTCGDLATTATAALTPTADRPPPRRRLWLAGAAALLAALAVGIVAIASRGDGGAGAPAPHLRLAKLDLATGRTTPLTSIRGDTTPAVGLVAHGGRLWISDSYGITRYDLAPPHAVKAGRIGTGGGGIAFAGQTLWMTTTRSDLTAGLYEVDTYSLQPVGGVIPLKLNYPGGSKANQYGAQIAGTAGAVWVDLVGGVKRIDAANPQPQLIPVPTSVDAITARGRDVWVATADPGTVARIDASTSRVEPGVRFPGPYPATNIAFGAGALWVSDQAGHVYEFNPDSHRRIPGPPAAVDGDIAWLAGGPTLLLVGFINPAGAFRLAEVGPSGDLRVLPAHFAAVIPAAVIVGDSAYVILWDAN